MPVEMVDLHAAQPIVDHLLFHKALHGVSTDNGQLDIYLDLATKLDTPHHVHTIADPFTRTVGVLFSMVMGKQINPWDLDLNNLLIQWEKQMSKVDDEDTDFILAGNLIHWAYSVVKLRSEEVLENTLPMEDPWDEEYVEDWPGEWSEWTPPESFVELIQDGTPAPLDEKIRHKGERKVTLVELLGALDKARHDINLRVNRALAYKELRAEQEAKRKKAGQTIAGRLHEDDPTYDSVQLWEQLTQLANEQVTFNELVSGKDKEGLVRTFLALLFLANEGKVKVFHRGPRARNSILVKRVLAAGGNGGNGV